LLLLVDNGSVYTPEITKFLLTTKLKFQSYPFAKVKLPDLEQFDSFILSGRRENFKEMNALNSSIIKHAITNSKPLLGICYGAEILALSLGGTIKKINPPQKGKQSVFVTKPNPLCEGKIDVFQSHSYEISKLNGSLVGIAESDTCKYEIIQHKRLQIYGTQFHPEMSSDGHKLIYAFISLN
jgi:GMP synthase (glutamine-hydrolysing)